MTRRTAGLLLAVAAIAIPSTTSDASPAVQNQTAPDSIDSYLRMPGDQVVTVPNGTYSGSDVGAAHPETDGRYGGWLVLQAESLHGVVLTGELTLRDSTSRILFVGFRFDRARVFVDGQQIAFWYTDHVAQDLEWYEEGRRVPRAVHLRGASDVSILGSDLHDAVATPLLMDAVSDVAVEGVRIYDLFEPPGTDPLDKSHLNVLGSLRGGITDVSIRQCYFEGARINHQTDEGDTVNLVYEDIWYTGAFGAAFQFNATNGNRIVASARINVRSWGHLGQFPRDRIDNVDGRLVDVGSRPERVDVTDRDVVTEPPPEGSVDPATRWRQEHPYDSWPEFFGWSEAG